MLTATEAAYVDYVSHKMQAALALQRVTAFDASLSLAQRFHSAGNMNKLALARHHANAAEARLMCLQADAREYDARVELANLMGLPVADDWSVDQGLPLPQSNLPALPELTALAATSRLDLAAARTNTQVLAQHLGFENLFHTLGEIEIGAERERETSGEHLRGPRVAWEIPLFSRHRDESLMTHAQLHKAAAALKVLELESVNQVHQRYRQPNSLRHASRYINSN